MYIASLNMKRFIIFLATALAALLIPFAARAETLTTFFGVLPTLSVRSVYAQEAGIRNYTGTYEQNVKLLAYLKAQKEPKVEAVLGANPDTGLGGYTPVSGYQSRTTQFISAAATTIPVVSTKDPSGNQIALNKISSAATVKVYMNLEPGTSKQEPIICTGLTATTWTGCTRGIPYQGGSETSSSTIATSHNAGASIIITNISQFYNEYVSVDGSQTINATKTFSNLPLGPTSTPTNQQQFITLYQFQQATSTGGINGSQTAKGVWQGASRGEMAVGTGVGSTGANLLLQSQYASSTAAATSTIVATKANGSIDSSFGGVASSLATLDAGGTVVQNPANATSTRTATKIPISDSNGLLNSWVDRITQYYVAGEAVSSTAPTPMYLSEVDGKVYKSAATTASRTVWATIGFAPANTNVAANGTVGIVQSGLVSGFSALSTGTPYFLSATTGTLTAATSTIVNYQVAQAVSSTAIRVAFGKKIYTGRENPSSDTTLVETFGFRPNKITVHMIQGFNLFSHGIWEEGNGGAYGTDVCLYSGIANGGGTANGIQQGQVWYMTNNTGGGGKINRGAVINVTSTGFTFNVVTANTPGGVEVLWVAEQ